MTMSDIETMIDAAVNQDFNSANGIFNELINARLTDTLEQEKINTAASIFDQENVDVEDDEDEQLDLDFEDDDAVEDVDELEDDADSIETEEVDEE
tara:strand:- start:16761 stop:17048 length:288 start_codon:yes stop_codon:yes gene_type:complete